jgi:ParB family protein of integrating conjugative element (PFGI_1 class)
MVLTLDQLRPYELNPRQKQNPKYEEIKESIRARGLDDTPTVSRRPGETDYIIDNGGNTRLKILNDLWKETRDERFYRIHCLFRPWVGDIKALTGHMSENDMRGNLLWIERCLGVSKTRELYEQQEGRAVSQAELARKLKLDGYPVDRTHINRMDQTIQHLFPCIPNILWNGIGHDAVRTLLNLRTHAESAWTKLVAEKGSPAMGVTFEQIFANALQHFDDEPESYVFQHVQDELVGLMTEALRPNGVSYELIMLEMDCSKAPANRAPAEPAPQAGLAEL